MHEDKNRGNDIDRSSVKCANSQATTNDGKAEGVGRLKSSDKFKFKIYFTEYRLAGLKYNENGYGSPKFCEVTIAQRLHCIAVETTRQGQITRMWFIQGGCCKQGLMSVETGFLLFRCHTAFGVKCAISGVPLFQI